MPETKKSPWEFCLNAIETGNNVELVDPMFAMALEFLSGEERVAEIQATRLRCLGEKRATGPSKTILDRRTGKRHAQVRGVEFVILNEKLFAESELEEKEIRKQQERIKNYFDLVSPLIIEACEKSGCMVLTIFGLISSRTSLRTGSA